MIVYRLYKKIICTVYSPVAVPHQTIYIPVSFYDKILFADDRAKVSSVHDTHAHTRTFS